MVHGKIILALACVCVCTYVQECVHVSVSPRAYIYIDSKEKRACNRVPIKCHSKAKNSNKFCTNYGIEAANVTKITTIPFRSWFEFC